MVDPIVTPPHPPVTVPAPLPDTVALNPPMVGTASPFLRVDGQNRDLILEAIRAWARGPLFDWASQWQGDLIKWLDDTENWLDSWNEEIVRYVQEVLQAVINNSVELQDPVLASILTNPDSLSRAVTDSLYASKGTQTTVESGRLSPSSIVTEDNSRFYTEQRRQLPTYVRAAGFDSNRDYDPFLRLFNERTDTFVRIARDINQAVGGILPHHVIFYGDSKTEGTGASAAGSLPSKFRDSLGAFDGFTFARMALTPGAPDPRWEVSGFVVPSDNHRFYLSAPNNTPLVAKFTGSRYSTGFRVWFGGTAPAGATVQIDSDTPVPLVVTGSATSAPWRYMDVVDLSEGTHTITLTATSSTQTFNFLGYQSLHSEPVLAITNAGSQGSRIEEWLKNDSPTSLFTTTAAIVSAMGLPATAIVQLGTNLGSDDVNNYPTLIDDFMSTHRNVVVVVPGGTTNQGGRGANKIAMWQAAGAKFIPLVDFTEIIGDNTTAQLWGNMSDGTHENSSGYNLEASRLKRALNV